MRRILVTGGGGFVGLNIAQLLLARDCHVVLFDKNDAHPLALAELSRLGGRVAFIKADIRDEDAVRQAASGADAIIHGAAVTPGSADERALAKLAVEVNIAGTINVLRAAETTAARKLVFLGSASVYGANAAASAELDEAIVDPAPESLYAVTKYAAERLALRWAGGGQIDLRCVRLGSVFGPWEFASGSRDTLSAVLQVTRAASRGASDVVLPRPGRRDWIYSRDAAEAVLRVLDRNEASPLPVNIGLGREWTVADWCERLSRRFPGFRCRLAEAGEQASIDYHGSTDRAPLATARLNHEIGFFPQYDLDRSFEDYMAWIGNHREFWEGSTW